MTLKLLRYNLLFFYRRYNKRQCMAHLFEPCNRIHSTHIQRIQSLSLSSLWFLSLLCVLILLWYRKIVCGWMGFVFFFGTSLKLLNKLFGIGSLTPIKESTLVISQLEANLWKKFKRSWEWKWLFLSWVAYKKLRFPEKYRGRIGLKI